MGGTLPRTDRLDTCARTAGSATVFTWDIVDRARYRTRAENGIHGREPVTRNQSPHGGVLRAEQEAQYAGAEFDDRTLRRSVQHDRLPRRLFQLPPVRSRSEIR